MKMMYFINKYRITIDLKNKIKCLLKLKAYLYSFCS